MERDPSLLPGLQDVRLRGGENEGPALVLLNPRNLRFDLCLKIVGIENGEKMDGNMFFDSLELSFKVYRAVRRLGNRMWFRLHSPSHERLTAEPDWTLKNKEDYVGRVAKNMSNPDAVLVSLKDGKEDVNILFQYPPGSDGEVTVLLKDTSRTRIRSSFISTEKFVSMVRSFPFYENVTLKEDDKEGMTNIRLEIRVESRILPAVLLDIIFLDPKLRIVFEYKENQFFLDTFSQNYVITWRQIPVRFEIVSGWQATFIAAGAFEVKSQAEMFEEDMRYLLDTYERESENIMKTYDAILTPKMSLRDVAYRQPTLEERMSLSSLRHAVPELFVAGYSRECPKRPFIVTQEEADHLHAIGRETLVYPFPEESSPFSRIYACPEGYVPSLKVNRLSNSDLFRYVPICHLKSERHSRLRENLSGANRKLNQPLAKGKTAEVPAIMKDLFVSSESAQGPARRRGVARGPFSFLDCVEAQGSDLSEEERKEIVKLRSTDVDFLDPRIVAKRFSGTFYIFELTKEEITLYLTGSESSEPHPTKKPIVILLYKDMVPFHCECIEGLDPDRLGKYKLALETEVKNIRNRRNVILNLNAWDKLLELFRERSKAYFIHDLVVILGNYHPEGYQGVVNEIKERQIVPEFVPKTLRLRFSSYREALEYYTFSYPTLFDGDSLALVHEIKVRLRGSGSVLLQPLMQNPTRDEGTEMFLVSGVLGVEGERACSFPPPPST